MFASFGVLAWIALDALRRRPQVERRMVVLLVQQRKRLCAVSSRR